MGIRWTSEPRAGVKYGRIRFENPTLKGHTCPIIEISGGNSGPRLCVMAGIHINESSSITAAFRMAYLFHPESLRGTISIIPVVSTHNVFQHTMVTPPTEGLDLHWSYPGDAHGAFNECLAHALLNEWVGDADILLDLHGGDLDERMARYVVIQSTGDAEFDARAEAFASCFDTPLVVALHPSEIGVSGRCCTALAAQGRFALVAEAGDHGMIDSDSVEWHLRGIEQVATFLGMIEASPERRAGQQYLDRYGWITAPEAGAVETSFKPGDWLEADATIGIVRGCDGRAIAPVIAPASGYVMMQKSPLFVTKGFWIGAIATPRCPQPELSGLPIVGQDVATENGRRDDARREG